MTVNRPPLLFCTAALLAAVWASGASFAAPDAAGPGLTAVSESGPSPKPPPARRLEEVIRFTVETHDALRVASEELLQADIRRKRFLYSVTPDFSFQAGYRRVGGAGVGGEFTSEGGGGDGGFSLLEGGYYGYLLTLTQPLYTGGRATAAYHGAEEQQRSIQLGEQLLRRELTVSAARSFYDVLTAAETVRIGEQAVLRARRHLERAEKRLALGEAVATDRLRAEVNLARVQSDLISFRSDLASARDRVQRLCSCALIDFPSLPGPLPEIVGPVEALVAEALVSRKESEQDRFSVRIAEEEVRGKKGKFLPSLFLSGNYYSVGERIDDQTRTWQAGIFLEIPIYERASRFFGLREARSALRQARLRREGRGKDIALEVRSLFHTLQAARGRITSLKKQVEFAEENLRLAERRFEVGLADSLEVVDAQTELVRARLELASETYAYEVAKLRLSQATGRDL